jgi:methionyl-tRNA formyltransferase
MSCPELRILFAGNPDIAVPALKALSQNFTVVGVLTNPDKPTGRGRHMEPPPVKVEAQRLGIPVLQYDRLRADSRASVSDLGPNLLISFACGHYFGPKFLALFECGAINIHPSLLPKYRGSSPLQFALLHGERKTGISVQRIVAQIDSGDILSSTEIDLNGTETTTTLGELVAPLAADLIVGTLEKWRDGSLVERQQDEREATFSRMLTKADGEIDWSKSAREIHCMVRAFQPWPRAYTTFGDKTLFITAVHGSLFDLSNEPIETDVQPGTVLGRIKKKGFAIACGDGMLHVDRLQLAQKKEMDSAAFSNGNPSIIGAVLGIAQGEVSGNGN